MHIPGKLLRTKKIGFFTQWAMARREADEKKLITVADLMKLPHAQHVAKIAGDARRIASWQDCCERGNELASRRIWNRAPMTALHA